MFPGIQCNPGQITDPKETNMDIKLNKLFASTCNVDDEDARVISRTLNWLGYYTPPEHIGLTAIPDGKVFEAVKAFQTDQNISATGRMRPDGATIKALGKNLSQKLGGQ